jgi:hypothetical protein
MVRGSNGNKIRMIVLKEKKNERTKREIYNVNYKKQNKKTGVVYQIWKLQKVVFS